MYTLRSSDGKEHGPLTARDVRDRIAVGLAGRDTFARADEETNWRPLSEFIEFSTALDFSTLKQPPPIENRPRTYRLLSMISLAIVIFASCAGATAVIAMFNITQVPPPERVVITFVLGALVCIVSGFGGLVLGIVSLVLIKKRPHQFGGPRLSNAAILLALAWFVTLPTTGYYQMLRLRRSPYQSDNCHAHLRSLAMSLQVFSIANNGAFPAADTWCEAIRREVTSTNHYRCPDDPNHGACGYAYNAKLSNAKNPNPTTVSLFESDLGWDGSGGPSNIVSRARHRGAVMVAFVNGRVQPVSTNALRTLRWDP